MKERIHEDMERIVEKAFEKGDKDTATKQAFEAISEAQRRTLHRNKENNFCSCSACLGRVAERANEAMSILLHDPHRQINQTLYNLIQRHGIEDPALQLMHRLRSIMGSDQERKTRELAENLFWVKEGGLKSKMMIGASDASAKSIIPHSVRRENPDMRDDWDL